MGRHYIFILQKTGNYRIKRNYKLDPSGTSFKLGNDIYIYNSECLGMVNGHRAIFVEAGRPNALKWPKFLDDKMQYFFLDSKTIMAILNTEHVRIVAEGGQGKMSTKDLVMMFLMGLCILLLFIIMIKLFALKGVVVAPPAAAVAVTP